MAYTATEATAAPAKANQTYPLSVCTPANAIASTTATDAPWLIPRMPGSAMGLRVIPWSTVPARASAAPTISPMSVRGTRIVRITSAASEVPPCSSASTTSPGGIDRAPTARLSRTASSSATTAAAVAAARRERRRGARGTPAGAVAGAEAGAGADADIGTNREGARYEELIRGVGTRGRYGEGARESY